jgi:deoxycytidylate deaminase
MPSRRRKNEAEESSSAARAKRAPSPETEPEREISYHPESMDASNPAIELVFGFVGPTGIDLDTVYESLKSQLKALQYDSVEIRLSSLISTYLGKDTEFKDHYERIAILMERGTRLREETAHADIASRLAIAEIRHQRSLKTQNEYKPANRVAYLIRSFKRPEEVELFRQVYGKAFTLISVYASRAWRIQFLKKSIAPSLGDLRSEAENRSIELINRDYNEEGRKLGQKVGKTFPLADFFVTSESRPQLNKQIRRLVQLTFGNPYISPTPSEQAMFFAKAAAMRSLDLSRQVGAAAVSREGELLTTGCNEVPKFNGGLYWDEPGADRDFERGSDSNVDIKRNLVEDAFARLRSANMLSAAASEKSNVDLADHALFDEKGIFKESILFDVIEFGRAVHAEMAAISQAARSGISLQGASLFCTTFPCHICSRHIVAAGIRNVVFIEPYEKSRTSELYSDSISIEPTEPSENRVNFHAFVGVAPRRYTDFFESAASRKTSRGKIKNVDEIAATPRIKRLVLTYTFAEAFIMQETPPQPSTTRTRSIK